MKGIYLGAFRAYHPDYDLVYQDINGLRDLPGDMLEIDLKNVWILLGEIIGESYDDELLDQLFSRFCVGK